MGLRGQLARGSIWISGARGATNLIGLVSNIVLARLLVPEDFGLVALALSMLAILTSITELSLSSALIQHQNPSRSHYDTAWTLNAVRGLMIALAFCVAAYPAAAIYGEPRLAPVMFALALGGLLNSLANPRVVMLQRDLIFWQQFMLQVSQKLSGLIVAIAVAYTYRTYWAIVAGTLAGQLVTVLMSYTVLPYRPRMSWQHARELFGFSIWLSFGQILNTVNWKLDQLLIGGFLGRAPLGTYALGDNLAIIPSREATAPLTGTLFPAFSRLANEKQRLASAYQSAQSLVTSIALPAGIGMALIADPLIRLTMGPKWLPAALVIQVLASVYALQTLGTLSQPLAMAAGETRLLFKRDMQYFLLRIPLLIAGLFTGGLAGVLCARAIAGCTGIFLHMKVVQKLTGLTITEQWSANARSLVSACAMACTVWLLERSLDDAMSSVQLFARICALTAVGAATYTLTHATSWFAMGKPSGPEAEVIALVRKTSVRLRWGARKS